MRRLLTLGFLLGACSSTSPYETYLRNELRFLRAGVDIDQEAAAVRDVLAQRGLRVTAELRRPEFLAFGAETRNGRLSAVRVITQRGVVVAADGDVEDLFVPSQVRLLQAFPAAVGDYVMVAFARTPAGRDQGCASAHRILPDGSVVTVSLDASALGSRACVSQVHREPSGRLRATIAFPQLFAVSTPLLEAEVAFERTLVGRPAPLVPVARISEAAPWLETTRAQLSQALRADAPFSERHALGVGRAAVALLSGQDAASQLAAYREAVGRVLPGSPEAEIASDAIGHIERGWLDADDTPPDAEVVTPGDLTTDADSAVIEPDARGESLHPAAPAAPDAETVIIEPPLPQ